MLPLKQVYPEKEDTKRIDVNLEDFSENELLSQLLTLSAKELDYVDKEQLDELLFYLKNANKMGNIPGDSVKLSKKLKDFLKQAVKTFNLQSSFSNRVGDDSMSLKKLAKFITGKLKLQQNLKEDHIKSRADRLLVYKDLQSLLEKLV